MIHFSSYMSTWDLYWLYHIKSSINQVVKDAPSPMLKKVASVPSRLYSKVWQEYWVISNVLHCRYCLTCNTQLCFSHAGSSLVCLLPPPWLYYLGAVLQIFLWTPLCYRYMFKESNKLFHIFFCIHNLLAFCRLVCNYKLAWIQCEQCLTNRKTVQAFKNGPCVCLCRPLNRPFLLVVLNLYFYSFN